MNADSSQVMARYSSNLTSSRITVLDIDLECSIHGISYASKAECSRFPSACPDLLAFTAYGLVRGRWVISDGQVILQRQTACGLIHMTAAMRESRPTSP